MAEATELLRDHLLEVIGGSGSWGAGRTPRSVALHSGHPTGDFAQSVRATVDAPNRAKVPA